MVNYTTSELLWHKRLFDFRQQLYILFDLTVMKWNLNSSSNVLRSDEKGCIHLQCRSLILQEAQLADTDWVIFGGIRMQIWIQPWFWEEREGPEKKLSWVNPYFSLREGKKKKIYIYIYIYKTHICWFQSFVKANKASTSHLTK